MGPSEATRERTNALYRPEVVRHATRRLEGTVLLPLRASVWMLAGGAAVMLFFSAAVVSTTTYARRETVVGWLSSGAGIVRAEASRGGSVTVLHVKEGDQVVVGAPLATLRLLDRTGIDDAGAALVESLSEQRNAVQDEAEAVVRGLVAEGERLAERHAFLQAERWALKAEIALQTERVTLAERDLERAVSLSGLGLLSRSDQDVKAAALVEERRRRVALGRAVTSIEREMAGVGGELDAIPQTADATLSGAAAAMAALDERLTRTALEIKYVAAAPIAGRVDALPVQVGQSVSPGETVAVIVPRGSELMAELYVPTRAAGFIEVGQAVRVHYEAFPYQRFGAHAATVEDVSRTVLAPEETRIPGVQLHEPVFRVRGRLARQSVDAYGTEAPLRAGMLLTADVIVDRRTLLEWLLDPLYAVGRR